MPNFYCNSCSCLLRVTSVPPSANSTRSNGSRTSIKSFVTNCMHAFCQNCKEKCKPLCTVCKFKCQMVEINEKLSHNIRANFEPTDVQFEQFHQKMQRVQHFQSLRGEIQRANMRRVNRNYHQLAIAEREKLMEARENYNKTKDEDLKLKQLYQVAVNMHQRKLLARTHARQSYQRNSDSRAPQNRDGESGFQQYPRQHHVFEPFVQDVSPISGDIKMEPEPHRQAKIYRFEMDGVSQST